MCLPSVSVSLSQSCSEPRVAREERIPRGVYSKSRGGRLSSGLAYCVAVLSAHEFPLQCPPECKESLQDFIQGIGDCDVARHMGEAR